MQYKPKNIFVRVTLLFSFSIFDKLFDTQLLTEEVNLSHNNKTSL